ncbi:hypothetical protein D3C77_562050 [compost metagenome]
MIARERRFHRLDGFLLIGSHLEVTKSLLLECLLSLFAAAFEQIQQPIRRVELLQCTGEIARVAGIAKPDAGLLGQLFDKGATVAGIEVGELILFTLTIVPGGRASLQHPGADHQT